MLHLFSRSAPCGFLRMLSQSGDCETEQYVKGTGLYTQVTAHGLNLKDVGLSQILRIASLTFALQERQK
jgi:hypothetical protein